METVQALRIGCMTRPTKQAIPIDNFSSDLNKLSIYKTYHTMELFYYAAFKHNLNPCF